MKAIKSIGILLAVVIGIALIASAILPKTLNVSQQVEIDAPVDIVWSNVSSWEKQDNWSPWYREDSTMKVTYEGTPGTLDSKMLWEGNDEVGTGSQEYTKLDAENHMYTSVTNFIKPWEGTGNASVMVEDLGDGRSKATWTFTQETGFIGNLFTYIFGVENMLNDAYAFGLGERNYVEDRLNGKKKQFFLNAEVMSMSMMFGLPNKMGVAFSSKTRVFSSVKGLNEDLLKIFLEDFDTTYDGYTPQFHQTQYLNKPNNLKGFSAGSLAYQEFAFSFGNVLYDKRSQFWKGGVTLKALTGLGATYLSVKNLDYELLDYDSLRLNNIDASLTYVNDQYYTSSDRRIYDYLGKNRLGRGFGIDFGVVYEYRPNYRDYKYRMDRRRVEDRTANKYLFKAGASVADFGGIRFNNPGNTKRIVLNRDDYVDWTRFQRFSELSGLEAFDSFAYGLFPESDSTLDFRANLPTSLNLFFDYQLSENLYLGASYVQTLRTNRVRGVRKQNVLTTSIRYETRRFEAAANMMIGRFYAPVNLGAYVRYGPFFLGADNLGGILNTKHTSGFNIFFGTQLSILHNLIPDRDGDQVSDEKDQCPDEFGSERAKGCPDSDDDREPDSSDRCPDEPGTRSNDGCPDPDNDGMVSTDDKCPNQFGKREMEGCPDFDLDGVPDHKDVCPKISGSMEYFGCPKDYPDSLKNNEKAIDKDDKKTPSNGKLVSENPLDDDPNKGESIDLIEKDTSAVPSIKVEPNGGIDSISTPNNVKPKDKIKPKPVIIYTGDTTGITGEDLTLEEVIDVMDFDKYDYYLILGVYENKLLADLLVKKLYAQAGVRSYIYFDESNRYNYVTFGRSTSKKAALDQLKKLDKPSVDALINGHVWWKKVPK
jgi:tetrahydromethanopterin S-methyltransferase subunit G